MNDESESLTVILPKKPGVIDNSDHKEEGTFISSTGKNNFNVNNLNYNHTTESQEMEKL